jgi:DNA-binding NarL/FixJ family response regulator
MRSMGASMAGFQHLVGYHDECERTTRATLGDPAFQEAFQRGEDLEDAVAFALEERPHAAAPTRSAPRKPKPDSARLTRREREIAGFIARGMSNREIAETLVIAPRTAETHVANILSKLGFTSRAQVSSWVAENRDDRS